MYATSLPSVVLSFAMVQLILEQVRVLVSITRSLSECQ